MPVSTDVKLSTIGYVIAYVKDTKKAVPFYRDTLGMKVRVDEKGWAELEAGGVTLALHNDDPNEKAQRGHGQPCICFTVDNLHGTYEALKAKGVKFKKEPQVACEAEGKTGMCADFQDPDGNYLSIFGYVKK